MHPATYYCVHPVQQVVSERSRPLLVLLNVLKIHLNERGMVSFGGVPDLEHSTRAETSTINPCRDHRREPSIEDLLNRMCSIVCGLRPVPQTVSLNCAVESEE